jgi:CRISPR-associated protein Csb2
MPSHFGLSIRFLDPAFHGRRDGGLPEWPPSPLRVFQSLVAAAAARWRGETLAPHSRSALKWLERQAAPILVAPTGVSASGYRLSVPNNAMDIVARAWCRGNDSNSGDANPATHRTMKTVRPTLLLGDDAVHYLWPLADPLSNEVRSYLEVLSDCARSVVALGWGVDMAVGHAAIVSDEEATALSGERWLPRVGASGDGLRVPVEGTVDALIDRYERFLHRLGPDGLTAPPPLSRYATASYGRATDPPIRPVAAFSLLKLDASGFRSFDTTRRALAVAGMLRYAAKAAAENAGWSKSRINAFILGHGESNNDTEHVAVGPGRFAYLPLPSIEGRGGGQTRVVGAVRRVILFSFAEDCETEIVWARRALSGQDLIDEDKNQPVALLSLLPASGNVVRQYTQAAASWATVTPVVLPGYDDPAHYRRRLKQTTSAEEQKHLLDRLSDRIDGLLRKAISQAGFSQVFPLCQ